MEKGDQMKKYLLLAALLLVAGVVYAQSTAAILEDWGCDVEWSS